MVKCRDLFVSKQKSVGHEADALLGTEDEAASGRISVRICSHGPSEALLPAYDVELYRSFQLECIQTLSTGAFRVVEEGVPSPQSHKAELSKLFPKLINSPAVRLQACDSAHNAEGKAPLTVGIVLSGGQAPGKLPLPSKN